MYTSWRKILECLAALVNQVEPTHILQLLDLRLEEEPSLHWWPSVCEPVREPCCSGEQELFWDYSYCMSLPKHKPTNAIDWDTLCDILYLQLSLFSLEGTNRRAYFVESSCWMIWLAMDDLLWLTLYQICFMMLNHGWECWCCLELVAGVGN